MTLRYAWVLSGRHPPPEPGSVPGPRAEFETFVQDFGAELLSLSTLDGPLPMISRILRRAGMSRLSLAYFIQSRAGQFDAIIASGEDIGIPIALASLFGASRTPIHMMFHGHHLESRKLRGLVPILRRMKQVHFHCLSEALRERTKKILGVPDERCHATGHGVDTSYFSDVVTSNATVISSAGTANRDYATLAAAVEDLPILLKIAADSAWVLPDTGLVARQWPANVEVRSYGSYARLRELYHQSRFVVVPLHPAIHACGYAVIAEAMAMGRAVIATRTDSPPDFLRHNITGLLVEAYDVDGLRSHIRDLLDHPEKAAELGGQARDLIVRYNSLERFCERLENIIHNSLLTAPKGRNI